MMLSCMRSMSGSPPTAPLAAVHALQTSGAQWNLVLRKMSGLWAQTTQCVFQRQLPCSQSSPDEVSAVMSSSHALSVLSVMFAD